MYFALQEFTPLLLSIKTIRKKAGGYVYLPPSVLKAHDSDDAPPLGVALQRVKRVNTT